jgi:hypothetical protein
MDLMDPEGEALHLMRGAGSRNVSSLLSPFSSLASGKARSDRMDPEAKRRT